MSRGLGAAFVALMACMDPAGQALALEPVGEPILACSNRAGTIKHSRETVASALRGSMVPVKCVVASDYGNERTMPRRTKARSRQSSWCWT